MQEEISAFYSKPQLGSGMPVYAGANRWGGGFFSTLARFAMPLLRSFAGRAVNVASRTASDVIAGRRPITEALVGNTLDEVRSAIRNSNNRQHSINKEGEGANDIFSLSRKKRKPNAAVY